MIDDLNAVAENVPKDAKGLQKALVAKISDMIERARAEKADMLPLCRLNVELGEGYDKIPPQRFGAEFVGRVANPDDLILFSKKQRKPDVTDKNAQSEAAILAARTSRVAGAKQSVEQEVSRILAGRVKHMCALPERHLGIALSEYVDKEDSKAFETMLDDSVKSIRMLVLQRAKVFSCAVVYIWQMVSQKESGIADLTPDLVRSFAEERVKEEDSKEAPVQYDMLAVMGEAQNVDGEDEEVAIVRAAVKKEPKKRAAPKKAATAPAAGKSKAPPAKKKKTLALEEEVEEEDYFDDEDEDEEIEEVKPKKKPAPKATAAARVKREAMEVDLVDDEEPKVRPPQKKAAATRHKSPAKRSSATAVTLTSQQFDDDDLNRPLSFRKKK